MDFECPVCKTTKYRNPSMKLLVNVCGHGLCESCVETLFAKGIKSKIDLLVKIILSLFLTNNLIFKALVLALNAMFR